MIFIDNVEKDIALRKYLRSLLPNNLKNKSKKIIVSFLSNLETNPKIDYLEDFFNSNTRILICTKTAKIGVDIPDIKCVI